MNEKIKLDFNKEINKELPTLSISAVNGLLQKPFDKQGVAEKTFNKHHDNPDSQYYQKTVDEIIEMWSAKGAESCRYGSMLDDYIGLRLTGEPDDMEMFKLDNNYDWDERLHGLCDSFDNVHELMFKSGDIEFVDREQTVYYRQDINGDSYYIKGRFDALFYNTLTKKWIVVDWKSSKEITKTNKYEKLLGPAMKLDACDYNTYTIQVQFYKKTLVDMGYLPEGTTYDDVEVLIVQMPGFVLENEGTNFKVHREAFKFDTILLDNIFSFAWRKNKLMKK